MFAMATFVPWFLWFLLSITSIFLLSQAKKRWSSTARLPPGPNPLPVIGNLLLLGDQPHRSLATLSKTYGPVMNLRLGSVNTVIISSPECARDVLQKQDAIFSHRSVPDCLCILGHDKASLVWQPPLQRWRNLRRLCNTQLFTPQRLDAHQFLRYQKVQELMNYIVELSSKGSPIPIGRVAITTSLNLLSQTIFSTDLVSLNSESSNEFKDVVERLMVVVGSPNLSDFFPRIAKFDLQGFRRCSLRFFNKLHMIFEEQINKRIQEYSEVSASPRNDFLDKLLECRREDSANFDESALNALLTDLFAAGSDTSSNAVEWTMAELLRNPPIMAKTQEEIFRVIGSTRQVEEQDISQLPYLQAVIKETLRIHPPVPFLIPRQAESTVELNGFTIPEKTRVLVNFWAIGREKNVWKEPDEFRPERFLDKGIDFRGRDFEFVPFGSGRRICPGLPLAVRMVHLTLASLLQRFEWKLPQPMEPSDVDISEKFGVTLAMACPLQAIAVPITANVVH